MAGSFASEGNGVLPGACVPGTSTLESGDAEHFRMELSDNLSSRSLERPAVGAVELIEGKKPELLEIERKEQVYREQRARRRRREREERELWEAESWQQQQEAITASSQWLCQHYQRHCNVQFPCCTQFYPCHRCHNISKACENEEAKACHATHLKCCYCQHEQEVIFYCHFTLLYSILAQNGLFSKSHSPAPVLVCFLLVFNRNISFLFLESSCILSKAWFTSKCFMIVIITDW